MGGNTTLIEGDTLIEAIEKLILERNAMESIGLFLDSMTIWCRNENTEEEYVGIGSHGIDVAVASTFLTKPKKNFVITVHFGK